MPATRRAPSTTTTLAAALLDVASVLVFVALGRAAHDHGVSAAGMASTAWPFLAGSVAGWLAVRAWRAPRSLFPAGVGAWLLTVAVGMVLRALSGQGVVFAFVLVALGFLGLMMLGWRVALVGLAARTGRSAGPTRSSWRATS